jgi:transcriptional regulator with XRE-family HTH domain
MAYGAAVKAVRTQRQLTQAELAASARLSRTQLTRIETGLQPGPLARRALLGALGFTNVLALLAAGGDSDAAQRIAESAEAQAAFKKRMADLAAQSAVTRTNTAPARNLPPSVEARRPKRPSATRRGYGKAHRELRAYILQRDPWCVGVPEGIHGGERVRTTVMDHIVSLRNGGSTTPQGCRGLCRACNARKAILQEGAGYQHRAFARRIETMRWRSI